MGDGVRVNRRIGVGVRVGVGLGVTLGLGVKSELRNIGAGSVVVTGASQAEAKIDVVRSARIKLIRRGENMAVLYGRRVRRSSAVEYVILRFLHHND